VYDFLFVIIELFSIAVTAETLQAEICRRERFLKGVGHFDRPLMVEGDVAHKPLLCGRNYNFATGSFFSKKLCSRRALSYGIKISPVGSLDWSQSTRVTDRRTDTQNYDSQDRASITASRGKKLELIYRLAQAVPLL